MYFHAEGQSHIEEQNGECSSSSKCNDRLTDEDNGEIDMEGISDGEIEQVRWSGCGILCYYNCYSLYQMLLSENEVQIKTKLWFAENGDYLKELEGIS